MLTKVLAFTVVHCTVHTCTTRNDPPPVYIFSPVFLQTIRRHTTLSSNSNVSHTIIPIIPQCISTFIFHLKTLEPQPWNLHLHVCTWLTSQYYTYVQTRYVMYPAVTTKAKRHTRSSLSTNLHRFARFWRIADSVKVIGWDLTNQQNLTLPNKATHHEQRSQSQSRQQRRWLPSARSRSSEETSAGTGTSGENWLRSVSAPELHR
jgi:hypothetical protein